MRRCLVLFLLFFFVFNTQNALADDAKLKYLKQKVEFFPEAKLFEVQYQDLKLKGIEVGDPDGVPVVLVGGYSSNLPYLRMLTRELVERGFRVFNYNPPGQGSGELLSGKGSAAQWKSFEGLVKAFQLMIHIAHEKSGGQKVVIAGHSLGGMQARMVTLGLRNFFSEKLTVDQRVRESIHNKVSLVVPIFSPTIIVENANGPTIAQKSNMMVAKSMLLKLVPNSLDVSSAIRRWIPESLLPMVRFNSGMMMAAGDYNPLLNSLFGSPDLDKLEVIEVGPLATSDTIPKEIIEDLETSMKNNKFVVAGLDVSDEWIKMHKESPLPTLYVVGSTDALALMRDLRGEIEAVKADSILVQGGHMGPLWDKKLVPLIVDHIIKKLENPNRRRSCIRLLK